MNEMTKLENGETYEIDYGAFKKIATFTGEVEDELQFFDISGKFVFTKKFIASGAVKLKLMEDVY